MFGETYAATPRIASVVPPLMIKSPRQKSESIKELQREYKFCKNTYGAPTVDNAGPLFPAEETKIMPCLYTNCSASSTKRPVLGSTQPSP